MKTERFRAKSLTISPCNQRKHKTLKETQRPQPEFITPRATRSEYSKQHSSLIKNK